jgi:hypothetical protein
MFLLLLVQNGEVFLMPEIQFPIVEVGWGGGGEGGGPNIRNSIPQSWGAAAHHKRNQSRTTGGGRSERPALDCCFRSSIGGGRPHSGLTFNSAPKKNPVDPCRPDELLLFMFAPAVVLRRRHVAFPSETFRVFPPS